MSAKKDRTITVQGVTFKASDVMSVVLNINGKIIQIAEVGMMPGGPPPGSAPPSDRKSADSIGFHNIAE